MSTDIDVLLSLYKEELAYAKHHSAMRANVTSLICVIASATLALARSDDLLMADLPLTIFIALLGIFGVIFNLKQYERGRLHRKRAKYIRILVKKKNTPDTLLAQAFCRFTIYLSSKTLVICIIQGRRSHSSFRETI